MRRYRPTIKDVAKLAGVSRQTVSRVVNEKPDVSPDTRQRVQTAIEELNYRPNAAARSMVIGSTRTLGCISPNLTNYTFASIIESAQTEARRQNYFILTGSSPTKDDVKPLLEEMLRRRVDGLLILNPLVDGRDEYLKSLIEQSAIPVIYLKNTPADIPVSSVCYDDLNGGYQATRHLLNLGHTSIATILGPEVEECTIERMDGYRQALVQFGFEVRPELILRGDWTAMSSCQAARQLLETGPQFSAIFAQNDRMAVGAIRALRDNGLKVPADVSVIGFDDIPLASYFDPPLTTMQQPNEDFGRQATRLLIEAIQEPNRPHRNVRIRTHLVERASCASLNS